MYRLLAGRRLLCAFIFAFLMHPFQLAVSQDDIDDLFQDPETGILEETEPEPNEDESAPADSKEEATGAAEEDQAVDIAALTTHPPRFSGSVTSNAGVALGFEEWPQSDAADGRSAGQLLRASGLYDMIATVSVDARPASHLQFFGSVQSELNENAMTFGGPSINELFVDYTLRDTLFLRAGKQGLTWGQGRLLKNPANLVNRVSSGVAVRGSLPVGPGSMNGVVYSIGGWVQRYRTGDPRAFAYGGLYEATLGPFTLEISGHYQVDELVANAASLTFGLGPIDLTFEGVGRWDEQEIVRGLQQTAALSQVYWESDGADWTVLVEYEYDSAVSPGTGHYVGIGLEGPSFGAAGWRPRARWLHAFQDDSGEFVPAVTGTVAPNLSLSIASPIVYGAPGSYYRALEDEDTALPVEDVVSVLLGLELSFSF